MKTDTPSSPHAVELSNVGVRRDGRWILRDVTAAIPARACTVLLGHNGCGKSTLVRVITGYLWPTVGDVTVLGQRFGETDLAALRESIRLVQPTGSAAEPDGDITPRDLVCSGFFGTTGLYREPTPAQHAAADDALARVGLSHVAGQSYRTLSSGERMRSLIARALVVRPALLILDEPTAGLDLVGREQVLAAVSGAIRDGLTMLLVTHHLEEIPADTARVLLLSDGRLIAAGPPGDVLTHETLSAAYRWPIAVHRHDGRYSATTAAGDGFAGRPS